MVFAACPEEGQDPEEEEADERAVDRGVGDVELGEHGAEVDGVGGDEEGAGEGGAGGVVTDAHRLFRSGEGGHLVKDTSRSVPHQCCTTQHTKLLHSPFRTDVLFHLGRALGRVKLNEGGGRN